MAAAVVESRKRAAEFQYPHADDIYSPDFHLQKRSRCVVGDLSPELAAAASTFEFDPVAVLRILFPAIEPEILQDNLKAHGNNLDSAVRALKAGATKRELKYPDHQEFSVDKVTASSSEAGQEAGKCSLVLDTSKLVDFLLCELNTSSDLSDARNRAKRFVEELKKSVADSAFSDALATASEEIKKLQLQTESLFCDNAVLKRAFMIQHHRLKDYDDKINEAEQLKQLMSQYAEQYKRLQADNYTLKMHLKIALQPNSLGGVMPPDVC